MFFRACLCFQELFFVLKNEKHKQKKKTHAWEVGMLLVPIVLRAFKSLFSENNKMLFPLFFQLFKEQKKNGSSLHVFNLVFSCFLCDFSSSLSSTSGTSTTSLSINEVSSISTNTSPISIISKYFEVFFC